MVCKVLIIFLGRSLHHGSKKRFWRIGPLQPIALSRLPKRCLSRRATEVCYLFKFDPRSDMDDSITVHFVHRQETLRHPVQFVAA